MNLVSLAKEPAIREPLVALGQERISTGEPEDKSFFNVPPVKVELCQDVRSIVQSDAQPYVQSDLHSKEIRSRTELFKIKNQNPSQSSNHPIIKISFSDTQTQTFLRENWDPGPT